ncbi:hypothetical protein L0Y69_00765 [bacterium]|nr:hypothetical protein [bacterium]
MKEQDQVQTVNPDVETFDLIMAEALRICNRCRYAGSGQQILDGIKNDNPLFAKVYETFREKLQGQKDR